ncbi:hypothetical protein STEG23_017379 [Scotinomys teguina]
MWSKRNTSPLLVGMQIGTTTLESSMANPQKIGNHSSSRPSHTTLGHIPKNAQSYHKDTCSTMFIAALFVIARTWKQPTCPSTEEWIRKMWFIYTMEYYAAEKNNDFMKFAGKWMELENVILSEIISPLSLQMDSWSSVQGLAVDLCIFFHQLLDEVEDHVGCFQVLDIMNNAVRNIVKSTPPVKCTLRSTYRGLSRYVVSYTSSKDINWEYVRDMRRDFMNFGKDVTFIHRDVTISVLGYGVLQTQSGDADKMSKCVFL